MLEHVLVYPNCTYSRAGRWRLESDSFVIDLCALLPRLAKTQPTLRFTLLTPEPIAALERWCEQVEWQLPTYNNTMRCHFDAMRLLEVLDARNRSWDYVWCHLPEQALALKNVIYNATDERPTFVGYSHWVEIPELNSFAADTFPAWLNGALEMERLGVTTQAMKEVVMRRAADYLSTSRLEALERIVQPMYLGTDAPPSYERQDPEYGLLVWNHRPNTYTGWPTVLAVLDLLWTVRQDFRVVATLADVEADRPYMVPSGLPPAGSPGYREAYFSLLTRGWVGLPRLNSHWTWPVAIADGMAAGLPYVVPRDFYIGECLPEDYPLVYDGGPSGAAGLVGALEVALNADGYRAAASVVSIEAARVTSWDNRIGAFTEMFTAARDGGVAPMGERSKAYDQIRELAAKGYNKRQIKEAMSWGKGIPWTPYRKRLRAEGLLVDDATPSQQPFKATATASQMSLV